MGTWSYDLSLLVFLENPFFSTTIQDTKTLKSDRRIVKLTFHRDTKKGIIIKLKHSSDALEEFIIFFPAVNAFFKEKNAGNVGVILLNTVVKNIPNTRHYSIV